MRICSNSGLGAGLREGEACQKRNVNRLIFGWGAPEQQVMLGEPHCTENDKVSEETSLLENQEKKKFPYVSPSFGKKAQRNFNPEGQLRLYS